jgi:hypothetical protein
MARELLVLSQIDRIASNRFSRLQKEQLMFNKTVVPIVPLIVLTSLMFPAAANAKTGTPSSTDDDAIFSNIGIKANSEFNDFFVLSMPSADARAAIDSLGAGMPPTVPTSDLALRDSSGLSTLSTSVSGTSPSLSAIDAHRLSTGNDALQQKQNALMKIDADNATVGGPEAWSMMVIGVGLVAFRLRRRPDMNVLSYA